MERHCNGHETRFASYDALASPEYDLIKACRPPLPATGLISLGPVVSTAKSGIVSIHSLGISNSSSGLGRAERTIESEPFARSVGETTTFDTSCSQSAE